MKTKAMNEQASAKAQTLIQTIDALIDKHSLTEVLVALANVCGMRNWPNIGRGIAELVQMTRPEED